MKARTLVAGLLLLPVLLAGCVGAQLRTAPGRAEACMDALLVGELVTSSASGVAVRGVDGTVTEILWPFGYSARRDGLDLLILDDKGVVVARQGNMIEMAGGLGANDVWEACAGSIKVTGIRID